MMKLRKNLLKHTFLLLASVLLLSCGADFESETDSSAGKACLSLRVSSLDAVNLSARDVVPTDTVDQLQNLSLTGRLNGGSEQTLATATYFSDFAETHIEVDTGIWTFTLNATLNGVPYIGTTGSMIIAGGAQTISFALEPKEVCHYDTTAGGSLSFDGGTVVISATGRNQGSGHGSHLMQGDTITVKVAGPCTIQLGGCMYGAVSTVTVLSSSGTTIDRFIWGRMAECGDLVSFVYTGAADTLTLKITEGGNTYLSSVNVVPASVSYYGGLDLAIHYTGFATRALAKITSLDGATVICPEEELYVSSDGSGTLCYIKNRESEAERIPAGTYLITISFYGGDADATVDGKQLLLNTYTEYVCIGAGMTSVAIREMDLNEVYTIAYYDFDKEGNPVLADASIFDGNAPTQFSRKSTITLPQAKRDDREFMGWYTTPTFDYGTKVTEITDTTENLNLYARWAGVVMRSVTFIGRNGETLGTKTVEDGECVSEIAFDHSDGDYEFNGWYTDNGTWNDRFELWGTPVTEDLTLYSKWYEAVNICFYRDSTDESPNRIRHEKGTDFGLYNYGTSWYSDASSGKYFVGWARTAGATVPEYYDHDSVPNVTEDLSLYAVFTTETCTITLANSVDTSQKVEKKIAKDSKICLSDLYWNDSDRFTAPAGCQFVEALSEDPGITEITDAERNLWFGVFTVTENKTYYVLWHYEMDAHCGYPENAGYWNFYCLYGQSMPEPNPDVYALWREHYTFTRWYMDAACTTPAVFPLSASDAVLDEDGIYRIHIYPGWEKATYTVHFRDGDADIETQTVEDGKTATKPASDPEKDGGIFVGWYTDTSYTTEFDFAGTKIEGETYIYASWRTVNYTVTFRETNGSAVEGVAAQTVAHGSTVTIPDEPTKDGYLFAGWYADTALTQEFDFGTAITKDTSVYAKWDKAYTVTFIGRDGITPLDTQKVREGCTPEYPSFDERDGDYLFRDFYEDKELTKYYNFWGTPITKDTTIYMRWVAACTITFYKNDGTLEPAATWNHEKGTSCWLPDGDTVGSRDGYFFWGWAKSATATEPEYCYDECTDSIDEDTAFYAVWRTDYYTITFVNSYKGTQTLERQVAKNARVSLGNLFNGDFDHPDGWNNAYFAKTADAASDGILYTVEATGDTTYYVLWGTYIIGHCRDYDALGNENQWWITRLYTHMDENYDGIPSRTGYTFAGWYMDEAYTRLADFTAFTDADRGEDNFFHVYAKWQSKAQTVISVELQTVQQDPAINLTLSGNTFSAASGFASYLWRIDGTKVTTATTNTYTVDTSALEAGVHNITLAVRGTDGMRYSATAVIKVQKE